MSLPLKLNKNAVCLALLGSLWGATACSGDALPPADFDEPSDSVEPIARVAGHMQNGTLTFTPIADDGLGVTTQGFSDFTSGLVSFTTQAGDGVGTGTCTGTQYCGTVDTTNGTGRLMDNLFVEVTSYDSVTPAGAAVRLINPYTASAAYSSVFVNSASPEAATYNSFTIGQTKSVEWKFNMFAGSPVATDFSFQAAVYASFRRTAAPAGAQTKRPAVNACGISGSVKRVPGADDAEENFELPFPYTSFDITYDRAVVGSNGYLLLYKTGQAAPTAGATNVALTNGTPIGFYPFWDDLAFDSPDGVCVATSGTKPNRTLTVTCANAKINAAQPAKGTWTTEKITYSVILAERTDQFTYQYNAPTTVTNLTRGLSATLGYRAVLKGSNYNASFSANKVSPYLPALATDYSARLVLAPGPANP